MREFDGSNSARHGQVVILGGSAEARDLAMRLGERARLWLPARDRVTGQGASDHAVLTEFSRTADALVLAPHPCDVASLKLGARVAAQTGVHSLTLARPEWRPTSRDQWIILRSARDAASRIPAGSRVLVTLGRQALPDLRALRHAYLYVRQLTDHDDAFPLPYGRYLHGSAPFTLAQEIALMRRFRIDAVLTRNAGGPGGWPKIAAARALGVPVYMVARPRGAAGPVVPSVEAAMNWLEARLWLDA
ncbi:precorrin-6A/cobalt-precorrin-6A reductase [Marivita sp.]|uniref:precorrin-6A/cobalt-precorrin-6A reductase n=1 Tax=Marivita sp. TaxID=2003365 RepID=UPI002607B1B8|nr:precorrin-6A/cobalt-precorrin-6A reductase [Marivita sp.]